MDSSSPFNPPPGQPVSNSPKALWAVIGALAVAVVALGGVLLYKQGPAVSAGAPPVVAAASPAAPAAPDDFKPEAMPPAPAVPPTAAGQSPQLMAAAPMPAPAPLPAQAAQPGPAPGVNAPLAAAAPAPAPCAVCGRVESVRPVQKRLQSTSGVGAVAGGVVGGLVGNQFGHGNGRAATTVLGAVGGGFAGNEIEKHVRTVTVYEVAVRMDNGTVRTVETKSAPPLGKPVTLKRGVLRPVDGHK